MGEPQRTLLLYQRQHLHHRCILNPHPGLSIAPATLLNSGINQTLSGIMQHAAHPGEKRPPERTSELATRITVTQSKDGAQCTAVCGHGPTEWSFCGQVILLPKGRTHRGGVYSGSGTQVLRSCKVRQQKREGVQALRTAVLREVPRKLTGYAEPQPRV